MSNRKTGQTISLMSSSEIHIEPLSWDTKFFGFKIGKIVLEKDSDINNLLNGVINRTWSLIYLFLNGNNQKSSDLLEQNGIKCFDHKTSFSKQISEASFSKIKGVHPEFEMTNEIELLAYESGVNHSRFYKDQKLRKHFNRLYKSWITKSLDRSFADEVLVYKDSSQLCGFVTLKKNDDEAKIGLIAVDKDHRGKGIGTSLLKAAEKWAHDQELEKISVTTQGENLNAIEFYEKNGFYICKTEFVHHLWLNDNLI